LRLKNITPTISAKITYSIAIVDQTVYLTGTGSTDGTALSYQWDFGDGTSAAGLLASHIYTKTGDYSVTLTATDACDFTARSSHGSGS
jgi:PKD repeat protein